MMDLSVQKRLVGQIAKKSRKKVVFNTENLDDIKESITKQDLRALIKNGTITVKPIRGISRGRIRKNKLQKRKGRQRGMGSRKGKAGARQNRKETWIHKIRAQRQLLKKLRAKELISIQDYHMLYLKAKGGFFRNTRHIKIFIQEHKLIKEKTIKG
jgi:large subunit ribosomal protein L19e